MSVSLFSLLQKEAASTICKMAEREKSPAIRSLELAGAGALGMGVGTLAGAGAAHLADKGYKALTGKNIPVKYFPIAAPILGAGLGLAYNLSQAHQTEELRRALQQSQQQEPDGNGR